MGETHVAPTPTAVYGFVLLMAAIAYYVYNLRLSPVRDEIPCSRWLWVAIGKASSLQRSTWPPFRSRFSFPGWPAACMLWSPYFG